MGLSSNAAVLQLYPPPPPPATLSQFLTPFIIPCPCTDRIDGTMNVNFKQILFFEKSGELKISHRSMGAPFVPVSAREMGNWRSFANTGETAEKGGDPLILQRANSIHISL